MTLELAEGDLLSGRGGYRGFRASYPVREYDRRANHVPKGKRFFRKHLNDSSLFSFKLADSSSLLFICVPDPEGRQASRLVREDMFDSMPDSEFMKLMDYVSGCNSPQLLQQVVTRRMDTGLSDENVIRPDSAEEIISSVYASAPNDTTVVSGSIWDKKFLGIPVKYEVGAIAAYLLFKSLK